jgi:hypothetical protein
MKLCRPDVWEASGPLVSGCSFKAGSDKIVPARGRGLLFSKRWVAERYLAKRPQAVRATRAFIDVESPILARQFGQAIWELQRVDC